MFKIKEWMQIRFSLIVLDIEKLAKKYLEI